MLSNNIGLTYAHLIFLNAIILKTLFSDFQRYFPMICDMYPVTCVHSDMYKKNVHSMSLCSHYVHLYVKNPPFFL